MPTTIAAGIISKAGSAIRRNSAGKLYAVFIVSGTSKLALYWSTDNGATWTQMTGTAPAGLYSAGIAIDSSDVVHVVWYQSTTTIYYATYAAAATAYAAGTQIYTLTAGGSYQQVDIALDASDVPHITWVDYVSSSNRVCYANKVGGVWNTRVTVDSTSKRRPTIAIDTNSGHTNRYNLPQIFYTDSGANNVKAGLGNANNATSFTLVSLAAYPPANWPFNITITSDGYTHLAHMSSIPSLVVDYITESAAWGTAGNWTRETVKVDAYHATGAHIIAIGVDRYIFEENTNNNDICYYKSSNYGAWADRYYVAVGTYQDARARWQYANNPLTSIDFIYSDGTNIIFDSLTLSASYSESVSLGSASGISDGRITGMVPTASLPGAAAISENAGWSGARPVSLPGSAALTPAGKKDGFGTATFAGGAALTPAGGLAPIGECSLPVHASVIEAANLAMLRDLGLACQAGLSLGAVLAVESSMSLGGSAVLGEGSGGSSLYPILTIPASGVISGIGIVEIARTLSLAGIAALPAAIRADLPVSSSYPATSALNLVASLLAERALTLAGLGALNADGDVEAGANEYLESVSLAVVAAAVNTALLELLASQSLDGAGGINATAIVQATAWALLSATGALTADHILGRLGAVQLDGATGVSLGTLMQTVNNVLLTGSTALTPAALNASLRLLSLAVTADLTASGGFEGSKEIFLAAAAALTSTLIYEMGAELGLACIASLTLQTSFTGGNLIALATTGQMQALGQIVLTKVLALAGTAGQMAAAALGRNGAFLLPVVGGLAAAAELGIMQTCSLAGIVSMATARRLDCAGFLLVESVSAFVPFFGPRVVRGYRLDLIINALKLDLKLD